MERNIEPPTSLAKSNGEVLWGRSVSVGAANHSSITVPARPLLTALDILAAAGWQSATRRTTGRQKSSEREVRGSYSVDVGDVGSYAGLVWDWRSRRGAAFRSASASRDREQHQNGP